MRSFISQNRMSQGAFSWMERGSFISELLLVKSFGGSCAPPPSLPPHILWRGELEISSSVGESEPHNYLDIKLIDTSRYVSNLKVIVSSQLFIFIPHHSSFSDDTKSNTNNSFTALTPTHNILDLPLSWRAASAACKRFNGHLAEFQDDESLKVIVNALKKLQEPPG